jgi:acyl-CoA synthetase (AMP-forming)/AMP-acid ligase II
MVDGLAAQLATHTTWAMTPEGLDLDAATAFAASASEPVVVLTTAFALIHWLDGAEDLRPLPTGSRMMLTGGYKGRARAVDEAELLAMVASRLGLGAEEVVPEYGMTELTSQAYGRPFAPPPWLKIRVVDPATGQDLPAGQQGLVAFFDLLNLDNISALLTGDLGRLDDQGRLTLFGRAEGAVVRGCSLTAEELGVMGPP